LPNSTLPQSDPSSLPTRLLRAVIVKAGIELLFVCLAVSLAAYSHLFPPLRGAIDVADQQRVAGWAADPRAPGERLEVQLFIDDQFIASQRAEERRDDVVQARAAADPNHGFTFALNSTSLLTGKHRVYVYAVRRGGGQNRMLLSLTREPKVLEVRR